MQKQRQRQMYVVRKIKTERKKWSHFVELFKRNQMNKVLFSDGAIPSITHNNSFFFFPILTVDVTVIIIAFHYHGERARVREREENISVPSFIANVLLRWYFWYNTKHAHLISTLTKLFLFSRSLLFSISEYHVLTQGYAADEAIQFIDWARERKVFQVVYFLCMKCYSFEPLRTIFKRNTFMEWKTISRLWNSFGLEWKYCDVFTQFNSQMTLILLYFGIDSRV